MYPAQNEWLIEMVEVLSLQKRRETFQRLKNKKRRRLGVEQNDQLCFGTGLTVFKAAMIMIMLLKGAVSNAGREFVFV